MTDKSKMFKLAKSTHYRMHKAWMAVCSLLVVASVGLALNTSSEVKADSYVDPSTAIEKISSLAADLKESAAKDEAENSFDPKPADIDKETSGNVTLTIHAGKITSPISSWLTPDELKKIGYIKFDGQVKLPEDSSWLFANLPNVREIMNMDKVDSSNVTNMSYMFANDPLLSTIYKGEIKWPGQSLHNEGEYTFDFYLDTKKVTTMKGMFKQDLNDIEEINLTGWKTSEVTDMSEMFYHTKLAPHFGSSNYGDDPSKINLTGWKTSKVTDMHDMFHIWNETEEDEENQPAMTYGINERVSDLLELDIGSFETSNVENMSNMFAGAKVEKLDLSKFDTSKVNNMNGMFKYDESLTELKFGSNWDTSKVTDMGHMFAGDLSLKSLDLSKFNTHLVTDMSYMFKSNKALTSLDVSNFNTDRVTDMGHMFAGDLSLKSLNVSNFETDQVKDMSYMFERDRSLTSLNVSNFETDQVKDMSCMFEGDSSLTSLAVSNFDTKNVTDMSSMFDDDKKLSGKLDLSNWDTSRVTDMSYMFIQNGALTSLDLSKWDVSKVTDFSSMFTCCVRLENLKLTYLDPTDSKLHGWQLDQKENVSLYDMFYNDQSLTNLDAISNWNVSQVTNMYGMFYNTVSLKNLDLSNWDTRNVTEMEIMFARQRDGSNLEKLNIGGKFDTKKAKEAGNITGMLSGVGYHTSVDENTKPAADGPSYVDILGSIIIGDAVFVPVASNNNDFALTLGSHDIFDDTVFDYKWGPEPENTAGFAADDQGKILYPVAGGNYWKPKGDKISQDELLACYSDGGTHPKETYVTWQSKTNPNPGSSAGSGNGSNPGSSTIKPAAAHQPEIINTTDKTLHHNAYIYDQAGKRANDLILKKGTVVGTYGTKMINGRKFYDLGQQLYVAAGNIDDEIRTLKKNAQVYDQYGEPTGVKQTAGTAIATHGDPIKIAGKKYYGIGNDRYIKKVNFNKLPAPVRPGDVPGLLVNGQLRHNAYIYDENGKRTNKVILKYNSKIYAAVSEVIKGRKFYEFGQGQRIAADNIDGTKRKLKHNAYVYNKYAKHGKKVIKAGKCLRTYGSPIKLRGKAYYVIGNSRFVKRANVR